MPTVMIEVPEFKGGKCPICSKFWKECGHSLAQMYERQIDDRIRKIVRQELESARLSELRAKSGVG